MGKEGIPKSSERLQAQVEVFADVGVKNFSDEQRQLLKYSSELAKITDLDNLPADLPEEIANIVREHKDSYIHFLREQKKIETEFIEENIKTYRETFQEPIAELKRKITEGDPKQLPEYLGSGSNGSAFKIEIDGKQYAAKFSRSLTQSNFEIKPLLQGRGVAHIAQFVSYSFEDGVVIMELLPGKNVDEFLPEDAPEYSDKYITQLISTVIEMNEQGLSIDPKVSNFMYDEEKGFSILDYHLKQENSDWIFAQEVMSLLGALNARKYDHISYTEPDHDEKVIAQRIERYKVSLPMYVRFLGILQKDHPEILEEWKIKHEENKKNPRVSVSELVPREYIPDLPSLPLI